MLVDTHCHLHDREFFTEEQALEMLKKARENDVQKIICIGTSHEDSSAAAEFAARHKNVYWTYGIHPNEAGREKSPFSERSLAPVVTGLGHSVFSTSENMLLERTFSPRPVAIGEVGLDYHYEGYDREAQIRLFEEMLQLAVDNGLPVSFHVREAFDDFFPVVANFSEVRGVVHSFTDNKKVLRRILNETGFYIGVNGLATYSTLPLPPLERILLETDAPFLAPVPHRGETNQPAFIANIAKWLTEKLGASKAEVAQITIANANALFGLK